MNLSSLSGLAIAAWVLWFGVFRSASKPDIFLDPHALILVVGGTIAAGLIAFPFSRFVSLFRLILWGFVFKVRSGPKQIVEEMMLAGAGCHQNPYQLNTYISNASHPFLKEGYRMIIENMLDEKAFEDVLRKRTKYFKATYNQDTKMLNALAKFPPAFGLLGASTGMIAMMSGLGSGGQDAIGPAMAVALVATFWGIAVANLILLPLCDYAGKAALEDQQIREIIIEGLLCIKKRVNLKEMEELMNSHIAVYDRMRLQPASGEVVKKSTQTNSAIFKKTG